MALALGAQAAWAQEATDPVLPDSGGVIAEETTETGELIEEAEASGVDDAAEDAGDTVAEVVDGQADEVVDDETESDMADDAVGDVGTGEVVEVPIDAGASKGAFRDGYQGSVSTLARAGLGRVFGALRSQGYGDIAVDQVGGEIFVSGARRGEVRHLVYDASTGALVSDVSETSSGSTVENTTTRVEKEPRGRRDKLSDAVRSRVDSRGSGEDRGRGSDNRGNGNASGGKGGGNGGSKGGGSGKGGGRNR